MANHATPMKTAEPAIVADFSAEGELARAFSYGKRVAVNSLAILLADGAALSLALMMGGLFRLLLRGDSIMVPGWSWLIIPVWMIGSAMARITPGWGIGPVEQLQRLVVLIFASFGFAAAALFLSRAGPAASRITLTTAFLLTVVLIPLFRQQVKKYLIRRKLWGVPTVIYGSDRKAAHVLEALRHEPGLGYLPVGIYDNESPEGSYIEGVPVLGNLNQKSSLAPVAILSTERTSRKQLIRLIEGPLATYRRVVIIPDLLDAPSLWVTTRDFLGMVGLEISLNLLNPVARFVKRATDIIAVVGTAPVWIPACLVISLLIWLEDQHHPLFRQERVGRGGEVFETWKFRTMRPDAERILQEEFARNPDLEEEWSAHYKLKNDPRITRIGNFLRRTSLDELPQLINVLRGEMSLVGPRPLPAYHYEKLPEQIRALRDRVGPGITGLWQVSGRSESGTRGMERWDAYYVRNWSVWLDIIILVRTARAVWSAHGAY